MRTLCDGCEGAAAILFCAADEAALCRVCDAKVHMCNKLASRHIRVGLDELREVPRCDICESAPAFFYCETDGSSLCLQCDMTVHVGGKRTHKRYLLLRQRVEFPGDKPTCVEDQGSQEAHLRETENQQNHWAPPNPITGNNNMNGDEKVEDTLIDLNSRPLRLYEQAPNNQEPVDNFVGNNHASENAVPGYV